VPARFLPYAQVFASMLDGVLVAGVARQPRFMFANDAAARLFEVPVEELLVSLSAFPAKFRYRELSGEPALPIASRALAGEIVAPIERLIRTPTGVEKAIRTSAAPLRDEQGRITGAVVLAADISAKKAEEARASEHAAQLQRAHDDLSRALADAEHAVELLEHGDGFIELDRDWVILRVNAAQERTAGKPRSESVGRVFWEVWPNAAVPEGAYWREYHRCMEERVPVQFESHYAPLDAWFGITAYPTRSGGMALFFRDITPRKRAERALRESEARFRTLTEAMPQIVCALAPDGRAEYVNPRWTAFSRLDLASTNEAGWATILHPDDFATAVECRRRALKTLVPQEVELRYRAADGTFRWFLSCLAPIAEDRRVVRFIGCAMDIEDRKRAEEAFRETDRRRTEFLGVLSHELRNPLAPIRNSIHILETVPEGPQATRARQVIRRQAEHLTRLVDDLLDATRISRGKVQLRREVVDLRNVVRRTCEDHRSMFADAELEMSLDFPAGPVWADVDPIRIAQVIGNLLHNAHKFTPPGGAVTVRLRGRRGRAEVSVRDDGAGIDPAQVARMFEPFAQEDRSLARTRGGLGLGLALSKGLVELHGGTITARSDGAGKGSEFTISLPMVEGTTAPAADRAGVSQARVRRRVLVIEDNADAAQSLADVLQLEGHEVTIARNGTVGVQLARELKPDLVICDLGLPDLDGFEVGRTLRADDSLRATRLIALSGYAQPEDIERARNAGFEAHLPKPAPLEQLDSLLAADHAVS
jgi:PAS domain S-box-containing protein